MFGIVEKEKTLEKFKHLLYSTPSRWVTCSHYEKLALVMVTWSHYGNKHSDDKY